MLRKAVTSKPYNFRPKSSENSLKTPEFRVTAWAVRDHYALSTS